MIGIERGGALEMLYAAAGVCPMGCQVRAVMAAQLLRMLLRKFDFGEPERIVGRRRLDIEAEVGRRGRSRRGGFIAEYDLKNRHDVSRCR